MLRTRIIPVILLKDDYVVKSINFSDYRYIGEPINIVKIFNDKEVDEIVIFDIGCTLDKKNINFNLIKNIATTTRMPFCYGGGIKKLEDAYRIFSYGIEKVSLSSVIYYNINFVKKISDVFGIQSTAVTLNINKNKDQYFIKNNNQIYKEKDILNLIDQLEDLGAGEIIVNCVHRDGTRKGFDQILLDKLYNKISIPITFVGGASSINEIISISQKYQILGLGIGSLFIYKGSNKAVLINYPEEITNKKI